MVLFTGIFRSLFGTRLKYAIKYVRAYHLKFKIKFKQNIADFVTFLTKIVYCLSFKFLEDL